MTISSKTPLLGIACLMAVMLASGGVAYRNLRAVRADALWVARTHEVLEAIQVCLTGLDDAETGERGYLITRDPGYFAPYLAARTQVTGNLQRLKALVQDSPGQFPAIEAIEGLSAAKLEELGRTLALAEHDPAAVRQLVLSHLDKNLMAAIRVKIEDLTREENRLLAQRSRKADQRYHTAVLSGVCFGLAGLFLALGFLFQMRRYLAEHLAHDQTLERQRRWLEVTLCSIGDAVIATDAAGSVSFMNPVAERLTGWKLEAAQGQALDTVFKIVHEQTGVPAVNPAERVLREGVVVGLANHTALISREGLATPIEDSAAPILDTAGGVAGVVLVFHDVADRRRAEDILLASEARYRGLADSIPAMLWATDAQGVTTDHNLRWYEYTGMTASQGLGEAWKVAVHPEDLAPVAEQWRQCLRTGEDYAVEYRFRRASDGAYRWHSAQATLTKDEQGRPLGWFGTILDIEARKRAETSLQESESRFRSLAEAIPQLCWMANADGHITWFNQRWHDYTGTTPEQMEGWGWRSVHDPEVLPKVMERWQRSLATSTPFEMVFPLRGRDGVFRPFLTRVMPVCDGAGQATRWFGTNTDITEQEQLKVELEDASQRKDAFLALLGHELRNPLGPIRNAVHLAGQPGQTVAAIQGAMAIVERQVAHMVRLVDDLLDVTRIARGRVQLKMDNLDLVETVRGVIEDYRPLLADKGLALEADLTEARIEIKADPTRIVQTVSNLLHNAVKFTGPGGRIHLAVGELGQGRAFVRVQDTGAGIEAEALPRLFEPFKQTKEEIGRSEGGLGLGLALAKGLVELHGGTLAARSDGPGQGAEFIVELPLSPSLPEVRQEAPEAGPPASSRPRRILVVDDLVDAATTLQMVLEMDGHTVAIAHSGRSGLAMAASFDPDLIFCDIGLPGDLDGYGVARTLRAAPPRGKRLHLIAMTGFGSEADRERALGAGFDTHLTKPVALATLATVIDSFPYSD